MDFSIGWVDGCLLAVLLLSVLIGILRGLVFEVLSLVGWVVAWFVAQWAAPQIAPHLPVGTPGSLLNQGAAFASAFIATLIVWSLLSRLVRSLIHATPLSAVDRLFGAGFGLLRGSIALLAVAALVGYTPAAKSAPWQASIGVGWLNAALGGVKPLLPPDIAQLLPA